MVVDHINTNGCGYAFGFQAVEDKPTILVRLGLAHAPLLYLPPPWYSNQLPATNAVADVLIHTR